MAGMLWRLFEYYYYSGAVAFRAQLQGCYYKAQGFLNPRLGACLTDLERVLPTKGYEYCFSHYCPSFKVLLCMASFAKVCKPSNDIIWAKMFTTPVCTYYT